MSKIERVELPAWDFPLSPRNRYRVPQSVWRAWPPLARSVFNSVFERSYEPRKIAHPAAAEVPKKHWQTIRWNCAWLAADAVRECLAEWKADVAVRKAAA